MLVFSVISCEVQDDWFLEVPAFADGSVLTGTSPLTSQCRYAIEGIYRVIDGSDVFGDTIVMKNTGDKISLFGYKNGSYFILDAGIKNSDILLEGYWRHAFNDETGLARFHLSDAGQIIAGDTTVASIIITGETGTGQVTPGRPVELELISRFTSRLRHDPFIIGAHRAGGRTSDKLPVSENSVEMINYTSYFGSTRLETGSTTQKLTTNLNVIPLFLSFSVKATRHLKVNFATGLALMDYTILVNKAKNGALSGQSFSMSDFTTGVSWFVPVGKRFEFGTEFKYIYIEKTIDHHVSAFINLSYNIINRPVKKL